MITVIICCYNSQKTISSTLKSLSQQKTSFAWELIIVDNNCTDKTIPIAKAFVSELDVTFVREQRPGLSYARERGFREAKYDLIVLCDDDNFLEEDYLETCACIMDKNPRIGILGGSGIPISDVPIPDWFVNHQTAFAVGSRIDGTRDITNIYGYVFGAGLVIRKQIIGELKSCRFKSLLTDRKGEQLSSGGDEELCLAVRLIGYQIWYSNKLKFRHFLPKSRLTKSYLRRLYWSFGKSSLITRLYRLTYNNDNKKIPSFFWQKELYWLIRSFITRNAPNSYSRLMLLSQIFELTTLNKKYNNMYRSLIDLKARLSSSNS